jgi:enolase
MLIKEFNAYKILNSRKQETIEVAVKTEQGVFKASAPAGASTGTNEVQAFSKKGIDVSIQFANALGQRLINEKKEFTKFEDLEIIESMFREVDKTKNFEMTGGNTLYAIEASILKAIAASYKKELWQFLLQDKQAVLPRPLGNCIGGGKHTKEIEKPDFQEFLILPDSKSKKAIDNNYISLQTYNEVKKILKEKDKLFYGKLTDENAFISSFDNEKILELMQEIKSIIKAKLNEDIELGVDAAASSFFDKETEKYNYTRLNGKPGVLSKKEQIDYIFELCKKYNLAYFEDPIEEDGFKEYAELLKKIKKANLKTLIVGDDLICTNSKLLEKAIKMKSINAAIIKPNQCGSLLETKKVIEMAKKNGIVPVISHRSGETYDETIAHLAVGWQIPIMKIGIVGKERFAKTNELVRIERKLK